MCVERVQDGVLHHGEWEATVQVHVWDGSPDADCFHNLLCQKPSPLLWTVAPSQLIQWLVFWTWTAMPFLGSPHLTACLCSPSLTFVSSWLIPHTPVSNPYKESCTPLLPVAVLSSHALVFFSESSLARRQAALLVGYRPSQSSYWAPWCKAEELQGETSQV